MLPPGPHFPYLVLFPQTWGESRADDFILFPHARSRHVPGTPRSAQSLRCPWASRVISGAPCPQLGVCSPDQMISTYLPHVRFKLMCTKGNIDSDP